MLIFDDYVQGYWDIPQRRNSKKTLTNLLKKEAGRVYRERFSIVIQKLNWATAKTTQRVYSEVTAEIVKP